MTMIQYLSDTGLLPGLSHDISMITLKLGLQASFQDIRNNYPNTKASLAMFSRPRYNNEGAEVGRYYLPQVQLTGDYNALIDGLWNPPGSNSSSQIHPWDPMGTLVPAANADYDANTASYYGFITAHNQFSSNSTCASKGLGGNGRRGSYRLLIFETDGMANQGGTLGTYFSSLYKSGSAGDSWYDVSSSVSNNLTVAPNMVPGGTASTDTYTVVNQLVQTEANGGFARSNQAVTIHCLAFGAVFDSGASGTEGANAATFLQTISNYGGTTFPAYPPNSGDPNYYKYIIGTQDQRKANLRTAILNCMKSGVRSALIQ
jgi:hypothetical protein